MRSSASPPQHAGEGDSQAPNDVDHSDWTYLGGSARDAEVASRDGDWTPRIVSSPVITPARAAGS